MKIRPRERFSLETTLTAASIAEFARLVGDDNPIHYDAAYASQTRFGRVIASGTHTTALLLGLTASYFSKRGAMVGLEFWQAFCRPVFPDENIRLEWLVVRVTPCGSLGGEIVDLRGRITGSDGRTAVGAKGRVLVAAAL
jgi:3-hydroxybutyryl-CoA dehydratase